ncbi:hypothetical protein BB8028_0002g02090 [Beauveria bassiana]|uniref:DUF7924 domain-containing protein n=1 Tax=Beauveria bassiana TaxID=176275 RepID=A0A2S7Y137_BEABA|nr:hypothetical protein BB8028_0002g02090 [Beauveria bassiana]
MARPQNRRRQRADEPSQQDNPPTKSRKRQRVDEPSQDDHQVKKPRRAVEHPNSWQYPPEFWDRLSKVPLIHSAIAELDRRTCTRPSRPPPSTGHIRHLTPTAPSELARFARHGGPDLRDLRGYPPATSNRHPVGAMSSSRSRATKSTNPTTLPTTGTTTTKKSTTPYNRGFEQHLTDHGVHPIYSSTEPELEEAMAAIAVPRSSLSPSKFSDGAFKSFRESNARAKDEDDVKADVIPIMSGPRQADHLLARNTVFGNLEPLTDGTLAPANPDIYYGAYPDELDRSIREELAGHIIPSTMQDKPMAPNFFMKVKGPDGSAAVATRQARYDGAIGSRGIHSLQNYGREEPQYDGQAYTFSSTYHDGYLKLYAHHITAPTTPGARPEYHMTQAGAYAMTHTRKSFVEGATAFRNVRDLAKRHRDSFIQAANARAPQPGTAAPEDPYEAYEEASSPHQLQGSVDPSDYVSLRDADDALQQHIADASNYLADNSEATSIPHYLYAEEDSQEPSQEFEAAGYDNPSFTSSFTSSFSTAKRLRQSVSPPSSSRGSQSSKSQKLPNTARRTAESTTSTTGSTQPGSSESRWVETYARNGKVYFRNAEGKEVKTEIKDWMEETAADGTQCFYWQNPKLGQSFWATTSPKEAKKKGRGC